MILYHMAISWSKKQSMPRAIQDFGITIIDNKIYTIGGYCSGPMSGAIIGAIDYRKQYRDKKNKFIRGFSDAIYSYDLKKDDNWTLVIKFPNTILPRASMGITSINQQIYCWGGYSFKPNKNIEKTVLRNRPPKDCYQAYSDGFVYHTINKTVTKLPNLPNELTNLNLVNDGRFIYLFGGAIIKNNTKAPETCITGNQLWKIDSQNLVDGWIQLLNCPGTTRMDISLTYNLGKLYVIGGIYPNSNWMYHKSGNERFYAIRDNWSFDLKTKIWQQLTTSPYLISNWSNNNNQVANKRYIYLIGGSYYYRSMLNGEENDKNPLVLENKGHKDGEYEFIISKDIYRYDIHLNQFDKISELPFPINKPKWLIHEDNFYLCGGESVPAAGKYCPAGSKSNISGYMYEGEFFGYHSDLFISGKY